MPDNTPSLTDLKNSFSVSEIDDQRLQFCLDGAIRKVKAMIGFDLYSTIFDNDPSGAEETFRFDSVKAGVLYLAMADVLMNVNTRIRRSGQVKREQDAGSPGMSGGQITNEYLTPIEINQWRTTLIGEANNSLAAYETTTSNAASETFLIERG
jgi:hypothetical protein